MRYLSLFSGIEACTVAWKPLGWECVAVCEIESFPCVLLKHHYPDVLNLGDITKITKEQIEALGHIDVVVGGFPCQDVSIAGKRKGLKHADGTNTRSGLFFKAVEIAEWSKARFLLVENVPGLRSNHEGRDFSAVVGELAGAAIDVPDGGWANSGFAVGPKGLVEWASLDAQFFGLAQRRERVFLVRDSGDWSHRPPILLERESLLGNPAPCREAGEKVAGTFTSRARSGGWSHDVDLAASEYMQPCVVGTLSNGAHNGGGLNGQDAYTGRIIPVLDGKDTEIRSRNRDDTSDLWVRLR